jgi:hypothetical protein
MLAYYPLEHLYYLRSRGIIPSTIPSLTSFFSKAKKHIRLDADKLSLWSCRFWALYVILHFAHLKEDKKLLEARQRSLRKGKGTGLTAEERQDMGQKRDMFWSEVVANLAYLPVTLHWYVCQCLHHQWIRNYDMFRSLEKGLFKNDVRVFHRLKKALTDHLQTWVNVFGLVAAVASFRSGWKATALPAPPPGDEDKSKEMTLEATAYDVSTS